MKRLLTSSSAYWLELDLVSRAHVPIPGIPTEGQYRKKNHLVLRAGSPRSRVQTVRTSGLVINTVRVSYGQDRKYIVS